MSWRGARLNVLPELSGSSALALPYPQDRSLNDTLTDWTVLARPVELVHSCSNGFENAPVQFAILHARVRDNFQAKWRVDLRD